MKILNLYHLGVSWVVKILILSHFSFLGWIVLGARLEGRKRLRRGFFFLFCFFFIVGCVLLVLFSVEIHWVIFMRSSVGFLNLDPWLFVDLYWKNEHRLMCSSEGCTATDRDRYEKSVSISIFCGC